MPLHLSFLSILFLLQLASIVHNAMCNAESLVARLTLCDTLFLLVARIPSSIKHRVGALKGPNSIPFFHTAACVAVAALLFVNFTHSLEAIFCSEGGSHDLVNLPMFSLVVMGVSVIYKVALLCMDRGRGCREGAPMLQGTLAIPMRLLFHLLAPLTSIGLYIYAYQGKSSLVRAARLDPYLTAVICLILAALLAPTCELPP